MTYVTTDLTVPQWAPAPSVEYAEHLAETAQDLKRKAKADSTRKSYESAWKVFSAWCASIGANPMPCSERLAVAYIAHLEDRGVSHSTAIRHLSAIRWAHRRDGVAEPMGPELTEVMRGHVRSHGRAARGKAAGLRTAQIVRIVSALDPKRVGDVRDRALILVGFVTGSRRSELAALTVADVEPHDDGLRILIRRGKADQEGRGKWKAVPYGEHAQTCPVTAVRSWLDMSGVTEGPLFRWVTQRGVVLDKGISGRAIAEALQRRAKAVGLDGRVSAHSLRRGFATEAAHRGVPRHQIMEDGGWRSSVVDEYIEAGASFEHRTGSRLGL